MERVVFHAQEEYVVRNVRAARSSTDGTRVVPGAGKELKGLDASWRGGQNSVTPVKVQPSMRRAGTTAAPRKPLIVLRELLTALTPASASR